MKRRIVQIATTTTAFEGIGGECQDDALYALADDGTLWRMSEPRANGVHAWHMLAALPDAPDTMYESTEVEPLTETRR